MRRAAIAAALFLLGQGMVVPTGAAQETSDAKRLLKIIEEQQRRLDAQEAQLKEQQRALQELRKEVEALQGAKLPATVPPPATATETAKPPATVAGAASKRPYPGIPSATTAAHEEWPGSLGVEGMATRFKISGFAELDATHDNNAIQTPSAFVTSAIVTGNATPAQGADGQTNFSVQASRLAIEARTPVRDHRLTTFLSMDFFGNFNSTTPQLRLREGYGEVNNILFGGDLLLGQTWSTYTNLYSIPNTLDYEGPNALWATRHPMARWTRGVGSGWQLKLAAEAPDGRNFQNATAVSTWPDGVVALSWEHEPFNLQGSLLARDLRATGNNTSTVSAFGWAAGLAGRIHMPQSLKQDFATLSLTYGSGYGGVLNDAPPDASYNAATNELKPIPTWAWYLSYQHWWNPNWYSVVSYGQVRQNNLDFQPTTAFRKTQYSSANLTWTPFQKWLFGLEVLYGTREDQDGADGWDFRTQFTSRFTF